MLIIHNMLHSMTTFSQMKEQFFCGKTEILSHLLFFFLTAFLTTWNDASFWHIVVAVKQHTFKGSVSRDFLYLLLSCTFPPCSWLVELSFIRFCKKNSQKYSIITGATDAGDISLLISVWLGRVSSFDTRDLVTPSFCQKQMGDDSLFHITMGDDPVCWILSSFRIGDPRK